MVSVRFHFFIIKKLKCVIIVNFCKEKLFDDLEIVVPRPQSGLGDNFPLGSSQYDFASLIYNTTINTTIHTNLFFNM
jgi:hypothetical protein